MTMKTFIFIVFFSLGAQIPLNGAALLQADAQYSDDCEDLDVPFDGVEEEEMPRQYEIKELYSSVPGLPFKPTKHEPTLISHFITPSPAAFEKGGWNKKHNKGIAQNVLSPEELLQQEHEYANQRAAIARATKASYHQGMRELQRGPLQQAETRRSDWIFINAVRAETLIDPETRAEAKLLYKAYKRADAERAAAAGELAHTRVNTAAADDTSPHASPTRQKAPERKRKANTDPRPEQSGTKRPCDLSSATRCVSI